MTNLSCPGTWYISNSLSSGQQGDTNYPVSGFENEDPYFKLTGNYWDLVSSFDSRVMYAQWANNTFHYPTLTNRYFIKDDPNCVSPSSNYDCINGSCIISTRYNSPGLYTSLEACESMCGSTARACPEGKQCVDPASYCPPGKVCLESSEYSQINNLIAQLNQEICG